MTIKHSVFLPQGFVGELMGIPDPVEAYETLNQIAQTVDELGFETLWVADHMMTAWPSQEFIFEMWTTVSALARDTKRIRIGQLVNCNSYRNPALVAKMASCVDVLSNGRFTCGLGSGWYEADYTSYGWPFDDDKTRLLQVGEAAQILLAMWTQEEASFKGNFYEIQNAINQPKGVQTPHIPLLIAGGGEKITLNLVAKYADQCNITADPEGLKQKFAVLKQHCEAVGRDYDSIRRTIQTHCIIGETDEAAAALVPQWTPAVFPGDVSTYGLIGTPATIRDRIAAYEDAGVEEMVVSFAQCRDLSVFRRYAEQFMS